jgi:hypothetical protein
MYTDPRLIRDHIVKLSFNEQEADLINAMVAYTGQQKAAFLREILLEQASLRLRDTAEGDYLQAALFGERAAA